MLLAIDIGNTNAVFGIHNGQQWVRQWRVQTVRERMPDEYAVLFRDLLGEADMNFEDFDRVGISSVVPQLTGGLKRMFAERTGEEPFVLSHRADSGIELRVDHPEKVGADLIADAMAAYTRLQSNCIVVDFGTATTVSAVAEPGVLLGTAIAAGLIVTRNALVEQTAQLPQIDLEVPECVIGKNTVHSMQAGLVMGHLCMVEGLVARMKKEIGGDVRVIATGGLSQVIAPHTDCFDEVDLWLTLEGLRLITERN
jgi:type III pantothenate kinase